MYDGRLMAPAAPVSTARGALRLPSPARGGRAEPGVPTGVSSHEPRPLGRVGVLMTEWKPRAAGGPPEKSPLCWRSPRALSESCENRPRRACWEGAGKEEEAPVMSLWERMSSPAEAVEDSCGVQRGNEG